MDLAAELVADAVATKPPITILGTDVADCSDSEHRCYSATPTNVVDYFDFVVVRRGWRSHPKLELP